MCNPSPIEVIVGILSVIIGCLAVGYSVAFARRGGNALLYIPAVGAAAFVAGVVAQHSVVPNETQAASCTFIGAGGPPGPLDAAIAVPLFGVHLSPLAIAGILTAALGISLLLFFEPVTDQRSNGAGVEAGGALSSLDDDDAI